MFKRAFAPSLAVFLLASPAGAASYTAKLAAPTSGQIIARDIAWHCGADACQGTTLESRPLVLCESLARRAGKVESFLVDGRAFTPDELATCDSFAKIAPHGRDLAAH